MTDYEFLPNIPIDEGHTLHQLTGRFQTVKDGLPELPKNSKDQYFRLGYTDRATRQIVIIVNSSVRSLAVLDFAGAAAEDFTGCLRVCHYQEICHKAHVHEDVRRDGPLVIFEERSFTDLMF